MLAENAFGQGKDNCPPPYPAVPVKNVNFSCSSLFVIHYNTVSEVHCPALLQGQLRASPTSALTMLISKFI